jgi:U3 small nucleolar RNA-associated protein 19
MIIPFTYNILKRHPALMVMIHSTREDDGEFNGNDAVTRISQLQIGLMIYLDPFAADESNPLLTEAPSSSLWELHSHRSHYHSAVSTLARIFSEAFTKPGYAMEDFLDHTYDTVCPTHSNPHSYAYAPTAWGLIKLFDTEVHRKIKKEPALAIDIDRPALAFPGKLDDLSPGSVEGGEDEPVYFGVDVVSELWTF